MIKKNIITLLLLFCANLLNAQNDYAVLNIYRTKAFTIGCNDCVKIYLDDQYLATIDNGGKLELKVFNTKRTKITVTDGKFYEDEINLDIKKGEIYHFNIKARVPRSLGFKFVSEDKPITKKLNSDRFIKITDSGILNNEKNQRSDTDWFESKLKDHWSSNGIDEIEGIYEKIGTSLEYELAVIKENNNYKLIYLSGVKGSNWNEGDIKAYLSKTAQFGIFKANWFMLDKSNNRDIIITFNEATMSCISEDGSGKSTYLKTYPTYDEDKPINTTDWKSKGSGFFIDKKGYIVTNYHVIENGNIFEIEVTSNGYTSSYKAEILSIDKQNDLAILKINSPNFKPLVNLSYNFDNNIKDTGSSVFALGYPLTEIMGNEIKFTDGKISSKSGFQGDITTYQISVPIQSGNSGGPLFDENGNLVGITSSGVNKQIADNANYAIKTSYLKLLIDSTNDEIELPQSSELVDKTLTEQIKILSEYVVMIKAK